MAPLRLTLLGGFAGVLGDGRPLALSSRKAQALLAYLALSPSGQTHPRDALTALLWGDVPDGPARTSLRQALSALRHAAGADLLRVHGDTVGVAAAGIELDVHDFEREAAAGSADALARAATLYRGDLLAGLRLAAPAFEEWLLAERERLRELAQEALARLFTRQRDAGALEPALQTGLRLLALDPTQEPVHRALMRLYLRLGRRGRALRQYQECLAALQRELGSEPEPETRQLYQQILRQAPLQAVRALDRPTAATPLIGREPEMARLRDALAKAWAGHGGLVAILGDAGIGKSRLVEELVEEAVQRGGMTLLGRGHETTQTLPFGPWIEALRTDPVTGEGGLAFQLEPVWRAELGRLFPQLGSPALQLSTAPENVLRLFEAVFHLLRRAAEREPLALVLEDLHWADAPSLRLLAFLVRRVATHPILLVGTAREEELSGAPALDQLLHELSADRGFLSLGLRPLSEPDTAALVRSLAPAAREPPARDRLATQVWAFSLGNPFMAVEAVRVVQEGQLGDVAGGLQFPDRVREVITARLGRLGDRGRDLAGLAAVIGRQIPFALLQRAAGLREEEAAGAVEELVRRRIVSAVGDQFEFTHDRLQEVAYASLLAPRRQVLHAAVGQALELQHADRLDTIADRLAYHYARTADASRAVQYLQTFAAQAAWRYAHGEAVDALEQALVHAERLPAPERDQRLPDLLSRLAISLFHLMRNPEIVEVLSRYRDRMEQVSDPDLAGTYHLWLGHAYTAMFEQESARRFAQRARDEAERGGNEVLAGQAHALLAWVGWMAGDARSGVAHGRHAIARLEPRAGLEYWLGMACWALGASQSLMGEFAAAAEWLARAEAIGEAAHVPRVHTAAVFLRVANGVRYAEFTAAIAEGRRCLERSIDPLAPVLLSMYLGTALCETGERAEGTALLERALDQFRPLSLVLWSWAAILLGGGYLLSGRLDEARTITSQGLDTASRLNLGYWVGLARRTLGRIALAAGALDEAERELTGAIETFTAIPAPLEVALSRLDRAELAHGRGHLEAASAHWRQSHDALTALAVPRRVEEAERLAVRLGLPLA